MELIKLHIKQLFDLFSNELLSNDTILHTYRFIYTSYILNKQKKIKKNKTKTKTKINLFFRFFFFFLTKLE